MIRFRDEDREHVFSGLRIMAEWIGDFLSTPGNAPAIALGLLLGALAESILYGRFSRHARTPTPIDGATNRIPEADRPQETETMTERPIEPDTTIPAIEPRAAHPQAKAVAFCDRESDLAPMTILIEPDGTVVARRRIDADRIEPTARTGRFDDQWLHVGSMGRYTRHDLVYDLETGTPCYDYSSWADGRLWLRSIAEWFEMRPDGRTRFERIRTEGRA